MKEITFDTSISFCQFSNDTKLVYVGDYNGSFYVYDVEQNYIEMYRFKLKEEVKLINNYFLITCTSLRSI